MTLGSRAVACELWLSDPRYGGESAKIRDRRPIEHRHGALLDNVRLRRTAATLGQHPWPARFLPPTRDHRPAASNRGRASGPDWSFGARRQVPDDELVAARLLRPVERGIRRRVELKRARLAVPG